MSHRHDCPSEWDARRDGERAAERGYGINPYRERDYSESYDDQRCRERAERAFDSGRYAAEERMRDEAEERAAEHRRAQERAYEEAQYEQQYEYPPEPEPETPAPEARDE